MADIPPPCQCVEDPLPSFLESFFNVEEPTCVLELVSNSPSPPSYHFDHHSHLIPSFIGQSEEGLTQKDAQFEATNFDGSSVVMEDLDSLFSAEVSHEMDLKALINGSHSIPVTEDSDLEWQGLPVLMGDYGVGGAMLVPSYSESFDLLQSPSTALTWCKEESPSGVRKRKLDKLSMAASVISDDHANSGSHIPTSVKMRKCDELSMASLVYDDHANSGPQLQLVDKLVACAQAVACHDHTQAQLILQQIEPSISPYGNPLQRIASFAAGALRSRFKNNTSNLNFILSEAQIQEGYQLMYEACPFIPFGHFALNSMIMEAIEGERAVHVIDLGIESSLQWVSFIQILAYQTSGRPPHLRITGVGFSSQKLSDIKQQLLVMANSLNIQLEFDAVVIHSLEKLKSLKLDARAGETVVVNSVLQFHTLLKESRGSGLCPLLQWIRDLSPKILTVVEQDANHNGPFFLGRFKEALHYYSAIFESLDVAMDRSSIKRAKIEQFYFRQQILNVLSCEGSDRVERHERLDQWRRRMGRAGFQPLPFSLLSLKTRIWLARYDDCDQYTLTEEKGSLVLGWRGKPIIAASAWRC